MKHLFKYLSYLLPAFFIFHLYGCGKFQTDGIPAYFLLTGLIDNTRGLVAIKHTNGDTIVAENGDTDTYSIALNSLPASSVTISILAPAGITVSPRSVVFNGTNWNKWKEITVTAEDDFILQGTRSVAITHNISSSDPAYNTTVPDVAVSILDNEIPLILSATSLAVYEGAGSDFITAIPGAKPDRNVIFEIDFDPSQVKINGSVSSPYTVMFTPANWNIGQKISVIGVYDQIAEGAPHTISLNGTTRFTDSTESLQNDTVAVDITDVAYSRPVAFQRGTSGGSGSPSTIDLSANPLSDTGSAFIICSATVLSSSADNPVTCQIDSTTQATIRNESGTIDSLSYYIAEFQEGVFVERGSATFAASSLSEDVSLNTCLDPDKSFVLLTSRWNDNDGFNTSGLNEDQERLVTGELTNCETLHLKRLSADNDNVIVEWQVINMSSIAVQSGSVTMTTTSVNTLLSSPIPDGKGFLIFQTRANTGVAGEERNYYVKGNLVDTDSSGNFDEIQFSRTKGSGTVEVVWYAVEFIDGQSSVISGSTTVADGKKNGFSDFTPATGHPALNYTIPFFSNDLTNGFPSNYDLDSASFTATISDNDSDNLIDVIDFDRKANNQESNFFWSVIEFAP